MIVTLVFLQGIYTTTLPDEKLGLFYLHNSLTPNPNNQLVAIEGIDDAWVVKSNRKITLLDENNTPVPSLILKPGTMYSLSSNKPGHIMKIYTESVTTGRQHYTKYSVGNLDTISIGRSENNIIIIDSPYVSSHHAELHAKKTASPCWSFSDQGSTNGTYINNKRGKSELLANGDMVTIVAGCQFFIVGETLAVNNPSGRVRINTALLKPIENLLNLVPADDTDRDEDTVSFKPDQYFETHQRSPRFTQDFPKPVFNAQEPPENQIGQETPFLFTLGPAITMGMASAVMILFSINKAMSDGDIAAATPSIAMATSMLAGVVLWPILSNRFDKKRRRAKETLRQNKYKDYIKTFDTTLNEECARQTALLVKTWPHISDCIKLILNKQRDLWEREPGQDDFLTFRIGTGQRELEADIRYPEDKFSLEDDNLKQELRSVCQTPRILMNVPLTVSLFEDPIIGIIGDRRQIVDFITRLLIKTVALYSYDDVKIVLIYAPEEEDAFGFGRWLPHIWTNTRSFRYIASTEEELKELSFVLQQEIDRRLHINDRDTDPGPYYIIFSLSHTLAQKTDVLKQIYAAQKTSRLKNLRMSVVAAYDKLANLPKESTLVVDVYNSNRASTSELSGEIARKLSGKISEGTTGKITYDEQYAGKYYNKNTPNVITSFISDVLHFKATPDTAITYSQINKLAVELALKLANIRLDSLVGAFQLPALFPFLSMFKVGKIEHLNPMTRWRENNPVKSLQAPVGINTTGDAFKLDIHEKVHGPHGLIAGMTGSGKSEFIMTFILSLAVNYHPHEVAFVLIDYKGGGMAKTFAPLPHTAGIITNLDGAALKRSLVSIQSELKRRQALFSDTSKHLDVSNIDIYKYQQYYREGAVHEPLQHLVLIADEFAELKDQQPEFLDQLVSAARIGRSLGIHLILATQKPAGVVNDQIWSNSRFRICLKVQDKADSQDMLKRPDAAELTDTGRFYLQVGYNEIFDLGQSAWSGANYFPADRYTPEKDDAVVVIDRNGRPLRAIKPDTKKNPTPAKSQLDAVTVYLSHIAAKEHIHARLLWLEPIAPVIFLDEVKKRYVNAATTSSTAPNYVLNPIIGEYDDPARQRQGALTLPLTAEGNTIIYGAAGSGKTTFLNAVIYSLLQEHTAADLNLYLLDFSAETLRAFAQAPQVGDIVFSYESEKVANLIKMLQAELLKRKKTFADCRNEPADMPNIVVVIHDFAVFIDLYEDKTRDLMNLTRECSKYRIYFILTALNVNTVRTVLRQNFKQLFTLQLNDPSDYHSVVGKTDTLFPAKYKGRGLVRLDDLYEFQIAFITEDPVPYNTIYAFCQTISHLQGASAPKIPVMPETIDVEYFADHIIAYQRSGHPTALTTPLTQMTMPIGIDCDTYQPYQYPFGKNPLTLVISTQEEIRPFLSELTRLTTGYHKISTIVFDPAGPATSATSTAPQSSPDLSCATTPQGCETAIAKISLFLENRLNGQSALQSSPLVLIISAYSALWNILSEESRRQLTHILERGAPSHNILVVLGEPATDIGKTMHMPWFRTRFPGTPQDCIWIGRGMKEQYAIEVTNRPTTTEQATLPPGYAFSVINGKATKIKLLGAGTQDAKGTATP